jgi:hypothetical protein
VLLTELRAADLLDFSRAAVDGSHVRAMKGGAKTGPSPVDRNPAGRARASHHLCEARRRLNGEPGRRWLIVDHGARFGDRAVPPSEWEISARCTRYPYLGHRRNIGICLVGVREELEGVELLIAFHESVKQSPPQGGQGRAFRVGSHAGVDQVESQRVVATLE